MLKSKSVCIVAIVVALSFGAGLYLGGVFSGDLLTVVTTEGVFDLENVTRIGSLQVFNKVALLLAFWVPVVYLAVLFSRLYLYSCSRGNDDRASVPSFEIVNPRNFIGGALGLLVVCGFFGMLEYLLSILPKTENDADLRGEYWLFIGSVLGALGGVVTSVCSYFFGSITGKEESEGISPNGRAPNHGGGQRPRDGSTKKNNG